MSFAADKNREKAWSKITSVFTILDSKHEAPWESPCPSEADSKAALSILESHGISVLLPTIIRTTLSHLLRNKLSVDFWKRICDPQSEDDSMDDEGNGIFSKAVLYLRDAITNLHKQLLCLGYDWQSNNEMYEQLNSALYVNMPKQRELVEKTITDFYDHAFQVYCFNQGYTTSNGELDCEGCPGCKSNLCHCDSILTDFALTNSYLSELRLFKSISSGPLLYLVEMKIKEKVKEVCESFQTQQDRLKTWLNTVVLPFVRLTRYSHNTEENVQTELQDEFEQYLLRSLGLERVEQLFSIIVDYPESQGAVEDLRHCLSTVEWEPFRQVLVSQLKSALEKRLLHAGVATGDILTAYISAIQALRQLDSQGVILSLVSEPVRKCLRNRRDTARCVVTTLLDESDLLRDVPSHDVIGNESQSVQSSEWDTWQPDPWDAVRSSGTLKKNADVVSILVSLQGGSDAFAKEYQTLLAERLLNTGFQNVEQEIRYLEILKIRFGENLLHKCEVMLKDMYDSKRVNSYVQDSNTNTDDKSFPMSAIIVSAQFWPTTKKQSLNLPEYLTDRCENFTKAFEALKASRTLEWRPLLGNVHMSVQLGDTEAEFIVTPLHAMVLQKFEERAEWSVVSLAIILGIRPSMLRRRLVFWQSYGILKEIREDAFALSDSDIPCDTVSKCKHDPIRPQVDPNYGSDDEDEEGSNEGSREQNNDKLQIYWSYIVGMLTNLESLSDDRIHQMLHMFSVPGSASTWSLQDLRKFLDQKVREHKLVFSGGVYRLPRA